MGPKPRVYARRMETVATLRKNSDLVGSDELGQANRALRSGQPLLGITVNVSEFRHGSEHLLLQTFIRKGLSRSSAAGSGSAASEPGAAADGYEGDGAYESTKQRREDYHEV